MVNIMARYLLNYFAQAATLFRTMKKTTLSSTNIVLPIKTLVQVWLVWEGESISAGIAAVINCLHIRVFMPERSVNPQEGFPQQLHQQNPSIVDKI